MDCPSKGGELQAPLPHQQPISLLSYSSVRPGSRAFLYRASPRYSGVQRACWLVSLTLLLMTVGCVTGSAASRSGQPPHDNSVPSQYRADLVRNGPQLRLAATSSSGPSSPRVGWVYRIEGQLDGQPVQYVGSAADLKERLSSKHKWAKLLQQGSTKVYAMEVFAQLDVEASNRQTLMSARNEALRAAEQRVLDHVREQVSETNMRRTAGQRETKVLNEINASKDTATWEVRHKVVTGGKWQLFEQSLTGVTTKAFIALTLMDAYVLYYQAKMSRYVSAICAGGRAGAFYSRSKGVASIPGILQDVYEWECSGSEY